MVSVYEKVKSHDKEQKLPEIFELRASPYDSEVVAAAYARDQVHSIAIYKKDGESLQTLVELEQPEQGHLSSIQWQDIEAKPGGSAEELVACSRHGVLLWDLTTAQLKGAVKAAGICSIKRDPHNTNLLVYVADKSLVVHDLRQKASAIEHVEHSPFLQVDVNPIKLHAAVTSSIDAKLRFFDLKKGRLDLCYDP